MEKNMKPKATNIISFLPKSSTFASLPHHHSPRGELSNKTLKNHHRRGFSGTLSVSMVPVEAWLKAKNGEEGGFETEEPTSPTVSCIGQIKQKKKAMKDMCKRQLAPAEKQEKKSSGFRKMFRRKLRPSKGSDAAAGGSRERMVATAGAAGPPPLGQMKRFVSGRETLGSFDWKKVERMRQKAAAEDCAGDFCYFGGVTDEEEDEVIIPHSAPLMAGAGGGVVAVEPKKEANLWKRRTFAPVTPLRLN